MHFNAQSSEEQYWPIKRRNMGSGMSSQSRNCCQEERSRNHSFRVNVWPSGSWSHLRQSLSLLSGSLPHPDTLDHITIVFLLTARAFPLKKRTCTKHSFSHGSSASWGFPSYSGQVGSQCHLSPEQWTAALGLYCYSSMKTWASPEWLLRNPNSFSSKEADVVWPHHFGVHLLFFLTIYTCLPAP